jgi:hypothetical protein
VSRRGVFPTAIQIQELKHQLRMVEPIFKERDELEIETVHSDGEYVVKVAIFLSFVNRSV